jgi:hypothetical protein
MGEYESRAEANALQVAGRFVYLVEGAARTYMNHPGRFEILDVSDPGNPVRVGGIETVGRANGIRVAGNYENVPESTHWTGSNLLGSLEIFDVSTPTNPIRVATYDPDRARWAS